MSELYQNTAVEEFQTYLYEHDLKLTRERLTILQEAMATEGHFEADDLLLILKKKGRKASRATVYRTLDLIIAAGLLRRIFIADSAVQFEKTVDRPRHNHFICQQCGAKIEFYSPELVQLQEKLCREYNFTMQDYLFQVYGLCSECAKENKR